jgi:Flp pilus assembly protein TadG
MQWLHTKRGQPVRLWHALARDRTGDTAVEFAMIGTAFFLFVFALFVIGVDQYWQMTLDDAVRNAARQVQEGNISATSSTSFITEVCSEFGAAAPRCSTTLQYSIIGATTFGAMSPATLNANGTLTGGQTVTGSASPSYGGVTLTQQPFPAVGSSSAIAGQEEFLLIQVAYPLPFKLLLLPGGTATENGTSSLYSVVALPMVPN